MSCLLLAKLVSDPDKELGPGGGLPVEDRRLAKRGFHLHNNCNIMVIMIIQGDFFNWASPFEVLAGK